MDRIAALNDVLTQNPNDTFARYGLAMEYSKQGDLDRSLAEFSILLEKNPLPWVTRSRCVGVVRSGALATRFLDEGEPC